MAKSFRARFVECAVNQVVSKRMVKQLMRWTSECSCRSALVRSTASYPERCSLSYQHGVRQQNLRRPHSDGGTRLVAGRELATTFRAWYPAWAWTTTLPVEELAAGT